MSKDKQIKDKIFDGLFGQQIQSRKLDYDLS